jgi:hypothetical protein
LFIFAERQAGYIRVTPPFKVIHFLYLNKKYMLAPVQAGTWQEGKLPGQNINK